MAVIRVHYPSNAITTHKQLCCSCDLIHTNKVGRLARANTTVQMQKALNMEQSTNKTFSLASIRYLATTFSRRNFLTVVTALTIIGSAAIANAQQQPTPLVRAHAHNDYEHARPLYDALARGFSSVEVDVYLVNGQLLVAHDPTQLQPDRTLQSLYLNPLRQRVRNNNGRVYAKGGLEFTLLIDVKTEPITTYFALRDVLKQYQNILTTFSTESRIPKAVIVIVSGNRAQPVMASETTRYAAIDGRLADLNNVSPNLIPLISDSWANNFTWRGRGSISTEERQKLRQFVSTAHAQGRRIRFYAAPDVMPMWRELLKANVDLINTDNLAGLQKFLLQEDPLVRSNATR